MENQNAIDTFNHIVGIIDKCEFISADYARDGKIENTNDYIMDAQVIKMSHDLISNATEKVSNTEFREDEYIAAIIDFLSSDKSYELVDIAIKCSQSFQFQFSMLGTFDFNAAPAELKVKRSRVSSKKELGEKRAPEKLERVVKSDKGAEKISFVRSEIQRIVSERSTDSIPYFEVVTNPNDFMGSIDNAFQVAFLVRDGILGLKQINNEPYIFLTNAKSRQTQTQQGLNDEQTVQTVMSLNPVLWREKIEKFNLKVPLLSDKSSKKSHAVMDSNSTDDDD